MSYTFSRRDFMKYTAVAAVAVAGSSMFTGCSLGSNPNRPVGKIGDTLKPGSKICDAKLLGGDSDKPKYDSTKNTLTSSSTSRIRMANGSVDSLTVLLTQPLLSPVVRLQVSNSMRP